MARTRKKNIFHKKFSRGFTLIELVVTVGILAFGIVTIYEALFLSMDTFGSYVNYLETQDWIDEAIFDKSQELMKAKALEPGQASGQIVRNNKMFEWAVAVNFVDEEQGLYRVDVTLSWRQGSKTARVSRTAYLLAPQLKVYGEGFV